MSFYIGNDGELHSFDDELYHWKYIKREKLPNGKWRYYYDKDALKKDVQSLKDKVEDWLGVDEKQAYEKAAGESRTAAIRKAAEEGNLRAEAERHKIGPISASDRERKNAAQEAYNKRVSEHKEAQMREAEALEDFKNTPLGALTNIIDAGKSWFDKLFKRENKNAKVTTNAKKEKNYTITNANTGKYKEELQRILVENTYRDAVKKRRKNVWK